MSEPEIKLLKCVTPVTFGHVKFIGNLRTWLHFRASYCFNGIPCYGARQGHYNRELEQSIGDTGIREKHCNCKASLTRAQVFLKLHPSDLCLRIFCIYGNQGNILDNL